MSQLRNVGGIVTVLGVMTMAGCIDEVELPRVDLVVDASRDGVLDAFDPLDQTHENVWNHRHGAVFLANIDDDDLDGLPDAADERVNGPEDALDLARFVVAPWPSVPDEVTATLRLDEAAAPHVRVFRLEPDGSWTAVLGMVEPCGADEGDPDCVPRTELPIGAAGLATGVELGIEATSFAGAPSAATWDGLVQLSLQAVSADGEPVITWRNPNGGIDRAKLRVAPWLSLGNLSEIDTVYAGFTSALSEPFEDALEPVVVEAGLSLHRVDDWHDRWTEDLFQSGYASMPVAGGAVQGMRVVLARPWGRSELDEALPVQWLRSHLLGPDRAVLEAYAEPHTGTNHDSFGNHDLIPPYGNEEESFPVGRLIYGASPLPETVAFYEAQLAQGPPVVLDVSWLRVGHVDEVFSYAPADNELGWKLLVASPERARSMMQRWQSDGFGSELMFAGLYGWQGDTYGRAEISIDEALADPDLAAWNQLAQAHIDQLLDDVADAVGLTPDDTVQMPFFYEAVEPGQLVAYNPGTVNARILGDTVVFPEPFGPLIDGVDGFRADLIERFGSAHHALGRDGTGMAVRFVDDWRDYHINSGEVHCATNVSGPPPGDPWWEAPR